MPVHVQAVLIPENAKVYILTLCKTIIMKKNIPIDPQLHHTLKVEALNKNVKLGDYVESILNDRKIIENDESILYGED